MKRTAVYPGTFDPVTYGHIDIIKRASKIFDKVIVAVARNEDKGTFFTVDERVRMLKDSVKGIEGVEVDSFDGLVVNYIKSVGARVMIRGLRMISDFEYEFQMALTNRKFGGDIETIFMMPSEACLYLSSKLVKEVAGLGGDVTDFAPKNVRIMLLEKFKKARGAR
ncbi:MAG: pantetheine-phosphate adenylyltransferase [Candidatus Omnitrophica bacterium]|nr:pantetheine-phosphate adenylyltransferase [Candidatus Omnitrophota bacterium]